MKSYTCKILDKEQKQDEILNCIPISDKMNMKFDFESKFKVKFSKREKWLNDEITFTESSLVYFTDGSKIKKIKQDQEFTVKKVDLKYTVGWESFLIYIK